MDARMRRKIGQGAAVVLVALALCASPARAQGGPGQGSQPQAGAPQGTPSQGDQPGQLQPFIAAQQGAYLQALEQARQRLGQGGFGQAGLGQGGFGQAGLGQGGFGQAGLGQGGFGQAGFGQGGFGQGGLGLGGSQPGFGTQ